MNSDTAVGLCTRPARASRKRAAFRSRFSLLAAPLLALCMLVSAALVSPALAWEDNDVVGAIVERLSAYSGLTPETMLDANTRSTSLGSAVADAVRRTAAADLAIVNGGDLYFNLPYGEVTWANVRAVFTEDRSLATAVVTPKQLREIIESAVSHIELGEDEAIIRQNAHGAFPQVSGFSVVYDASAPPGSRLISITLDSGTALDFSDDEMTLTLAATEHMLSGGYEIPPLAHTPAGSTLAAAFADYVAAGIDASYEDADLRVSSIGSRDSRPFTHLPRSSILVCAALLVGIIMAVRGRFSKIGLFRKPGER